jgi:DNA-directed RNA polymerase subunit RPC12/RpoP
MPEGMLFKCPSCGSALSPQGDAAEIKCQYCGNTVIVPEELRTPSARSESAPTFAPQREESTSSSPLGIIAAAVIVLAVCGVIGFVILGALSGGPKGSPIAQALASPTPAGFAHVVLSFGGEGTAPGLFQDARHIGVDPDGNMYVDEANTPRVQKFDPTGKYVSGWNVDENLCSNKSASRDAVNADRAGNVYVHYCGSILKYDRATGKLLEQFKGDNDAPRVFYMNEILYPDAGMLVLADGAPNAEEVLEHLDANGQVVARYANPVTAQSKNPTGAGLIEPAMDGLGNIFLLNRSESTVYKFTPDGKYVSRFGSVGTGTGQFNAAALLIAVDNQSRVYVTDFAGIKVFDSNGTYLDSMKDSMINGGLYDMRFDDKNNLYVVGKNMIYKLALNAK